MKKLKFYLFALLSVMIVGIMNVNAEETIKELSLLDECLSSDVAVCTLGANIEAQDSIFVDGSNVTLDLNGYTLSLDKDVYENAIIVVKHGGKLTIKDSSAEKTGKVSYITDLTTNAVRTAIKMTKSGGDNTKVAELVLESGRVEGDSYAISGNGNPGRDNTKVTINGGVLYAKGTGIFQPQEGELIVNGGSIEGKSGIEIRSGSLVVNGGVITGITKPRESEKNGNGTTTVGAGIAVVQHTTTHDINIVINGGKIKGYTPFYQDSIEDNSDSTKVALSITNGEFVIINEGDYAVYSGDKEGFITGGVYSKDVNEKYLSDTVVSKKVGDTFTVGKEHSVKIESVTAGKVEVDKAKAIVGETVKLTLTPNEGYELSKLEVKTADGKTVEVKENAFVMPDAEVTVTAVYSKVTATAEIPVVSEKDEVKEVVVGVKEATKVESVLLDSLKENEELAKIAEDKSVKVAVEIEKVEEKAIDTKVVESIKEKAGKTTIAEFFDINILVKDALNNSNLGNITELTEEIELMILLPEELKNSKEGTTRKYYVVRHHEVDGKEEVELLEAKVSEDGKYLVFKTDKFSTYALAYEDVAATPNTPQTGDSIGLYILLGFISVAAISLSLKTLKRKY